jgi:hypothetical protein
MATQGGQRLSTPDLAAPYHGDAAALRRVEGGSSVALNLLVQAHSEDDRAHPRAHGSQLDRRVRPVLGDHCLVGKSPEGSRQPGGELKPGTILFYVRPKIRRLI